MFGNYIMTETTSSGIKLSFQTKGNYKYAKVPGISYRENGKIRKKGTILQIILF